jgi:hypothetical protein
MGIVSPSRAGPAAPCRIPQFAMPRPWPARAGPGQAKPSVLEMKTSCQTVRSRRERHRRPRRTGLHISQTAARAAPRQRHRRPESRIVAKARDHRSRTLKIDRIRVIVKERTGFVIIALIVGHGGPASLTGTAYMLPHRAPPRTGRERLHEASTTARRARGQVPKTFPDAIRRHLQTLIRVDMPGHNRRLRHSAQTWPIVSTGESDPICG